MKRLHVGLDTVNNTHIIHGDVHDYQPDEIIEEVVGGQLLSIAGNDGLKKE